MKRTLSLALLCIFALALAASAADNSSKPRIAVIEFKNKADNQWWYHGRAEALQADL